MSHGVDGLVKNADAFITHKEKGENFRELLTLDHGTKEYGIIFHILYSCNIITRIDFSLKWYVWFTEVKFCVLYCKISSR